MILLLVLIVVVYGFIAVAAALWGTNERRFDILTIAVLPCVWPLSIPLMFAYGTITLRIKWRKYRGGRYLRKTFDAAAIDAHFERMASYGHDAKGE
jgi:hypothetical protein